MPTTQFQTTESQAEITALKTWINTFLTGRCTASIIMSTLSQVKSASRPWEVFCTSAMLSEVEGRIALPDDQDEKQTYLTAIRAASEYLRLRGTRHSNDDAGVMYFTDPVDVKKHLALGLRYDSAARETYGTHASDALVRSSGWPWDEKNNDARAEAHAHVAFLELRARIEDWEAVHGTEPRHAAGRSSEGWRDARHGDEVLDYSAQH